MRSEEANPIRRSERERGFSLLEMLTVVALLIVMASITFISMVPVLKQQRLNNAYNTTLAAMRQARDNSIAQNTSYSVTFSSSATPNTITVAPALSTGFTGQQTAVTYTLPNDITFLAQSGLPTSATTVPDGFGAGTVAIDFGYTGSNTTGGLNYVYFCPDGSAQNDTTGNCAGNWDGGVLYLARSGDLLSSRAITLWGGTGRIHGWRLYPKSGGGYQWVRQ
jgi:prepilin-type N-terminal cleavage/methylation domain-containing protein